MNNDTYRVVRKDGEELDTVAQETRLAISLSRIVKNRDWKVVCEDYLKPRLEGARERADTLEGADLFRFQGEIRILKNLLNLQAALEAQQNTLAHGTTQTEDYEQFNP